MVGLWICYEEQYLFSPSNLSRNNTTAHLWYNSHFTSISACGVRRVRARIQVSRRKTHTHTTDILLKKCDI